MLLATSSCKRTIRFIFGSRPARCLLRYRPWLDILEGRLAPTVTLSISNPAPFPKPDSGQVLGLFVVTRSGDLAPTVQVDYHSQDGSGANGAHAGVDYVATSGTLNFASNQTMATIAVPILGNAIFQADKTFTVGLSNPQSSVVDFAPQQTFIVGSRPFSVAVADFNGDGKPDLAIANARDNTVSVLLNTTAPGATIPSFTPQRTFATGSGPRSVAVADFNGDGKPDLAVATYDPSRGGTVSVLLNTTASGATIPSFAPYQTFSAGYEPPSSVAVGDFNGDGKPDIAVPDSGHLTNGSVLVLVNTTAPGATTPSFAPALTFTATYGASFVAVGDFNGDGKPDLAVTSSAFGTVSVLLNTTQGITPSFAPQRTFTAGTNPSSVVVGDFNGDGKPDLAITNDNCCTVSVLLNTTPKGATIPSFAPQQFFATGGIHPSSVVVGDFNGDGKPDLGVTNFNDNTVSVLLNTTAPGATIPTFAPQKTFPTGTRPRGVAIGDFNGDGKPDLAITDYGSGTVSVLLNSAAPITLNGSPATGAISSAPEAPTAIAVVPGTTPQSAVVNTAFTSALAVDVRNAAGHLVQNVSVTFTVPGSGPSGKFGGSTSVTVVTNASGRATAPTLVANTNAGSYMVTAQAAGGSNPSTSFSLTNTPATPASLGVSGFPLSVVAGVPGGFTVVARDPYGNIATNYLGTVNFSSSDPRANLPASYTFTATDNGQHNFTAYFWTSGTQSLSAMDAANHFTGTQGGIMVNPAPVDHLTVTTSVGSTTAGQPFMATLTAYDLYGNIASGYLGTVHFTSSDMQATLPTDYTFTAADAGVHHFGVTLRTSAAYGSGPQTITAADAARSISDTGTVIVSPAAAISLMVQGPDCGCAIAGEHYAVVTYALDPYGNIDTSYQGPPQLTSTDPQMDYTEDSTGGGITDFSVRLLTAGPQTLTAADSATGLAGSTTITVIPAPAVAFQVIAPARAVSGTPFDVGLIAVDPYGNTATSYQGTVTWTTTDPDPSVQLPADYTFQPGDQGMVTFSGGATLVTAGDQVLTATDTANNTITGSATITVSGTGPGARRQLPSHGRNTAYTHAPRRSVQADMEVASADRFFADLCRVQLGSLGAPNHDRRATARPQGLGWMWEQDL